MNISVSQLSRIVAVLLLCVFIVGCGGFDPDEQIGAVELFGVEGGIAYYDIIIKNTGWNWNSANDEQRQQVIDAAISRVEAAFEADDVGYATLYDISAKLNNGDNAFIIRAGSSTARTYTNGILD